MGHQSTLDEVRRQISTHDCPQCGGPAYCAIEAGRSSTLCWCMDKPKTYNPDAEADACFCKRCLLEDS